MTTTFGATVWSSAAVDDIRKLVFIGTGQAYEQPAGPRTDALIAMGKAATPALIKTLVQSPQPRVRANAARALALIADPSAIPALFGALEDESSLVQHWADHGLERMGVGQVYFKP